MMLYLKIVLLVALLMLPNTGACQDSMVPPSPEKADEQMDREASELDTWSKEQFGINSTRTPVELAPPSDVQSDVDTMEMPVISTPSPTPRREDSIMQTTTPSSSSSGRSYISDDVVRGAEKGAAVGAAGGAVGGAARKGAKIGAAAGAIAEEIRRERADEQQGQ